MYLDVYKAESQKWVCLRPGGGTYGGNSFREPNWYPWEKRRNQQTPQVTRLHTKLVTVFCSGEVKGDNLRWSMVLGKRHHLGNEVVDGIHWRCRWYRFQAMEREGLFSGSNFINLKRFSQLPTILSVFPSVYFYFLPPEGGRKRISMFCPQAWDACNIF